MDKIQILNRNVLKYIAIIAMTFNHIAHTLLNPNTMLYAIFESIGYFTAITMSYLMAEGFEYTSSKLKYIWRLLICASISQIPFSIMNPVPQLNTMFSLSICFMIMCIIDSDKINCVIKIAAIVLLIYASLFCDWPLILPTSTLLFHLSKSNKLFSWLSYVAVISLSVLSCTLSLSCTGSATLKNIIAESIVYIIPMTCSAIACLLLYNHKQPTKHRQFNKYMFYVYYPTHIIILILIKFFLSLSN